MQKILLPAIIVSVMFLSLSCASQVKLTASWTNKEAKIKSSPKIMVMALGKPSSEVRKEIEDKIVSRLNKEGFKAIPATGILKPDAPKYDSAGLVKILRENNIDMLLTNAVVHRSENSRFIPGTLQSNDIAVPSGGTANPNIPYNNIASGDYNYVNYYSYYNYYNSPSSYKIIESQKPVGETVTDILIVIESNLYLVDTPSLIWRGQSKSTTKDPTPGEINTFCKAVISDIMKNNLLLK